MLYNNNEPWNIVPHRELNPLPSIHCEEESKEIRGKKNNIIKNLVSYTNFNSYSPSCSFSEFEHKLSKYPLDILEALDSCLGWVFSQRVAIYNTHQDVIQNEHREDIIVSLLKVPQDQWVEIRKQAAFLIPPQDSSHDFAWAIQELCDIENPKLREKVKDIAADHYKWGFSSQLRARILSSLANNTFVVLVNDKNEITKCINKTIEAYKLETGKDL